MGSRSSRGLVAAPGDHHHRARVPLLPPVLLLPRVLVLVAWRWPRRRLVRAPMAVVAPASMESVVEEEAPCPNLVGHGVWMMTGCG